MAQEERSEERNRDVSGNMADRAGDYLESLLIDAFKGKGFQKIDELLQEKEVEFPQKYSDSLFNQLDKALRKELDKNEFKNVSLLLKCIQLYLKSDLQEGKSLFIEQGLVAKLVSWFERARVFVTIIDANENKFLMLLLEDFFDSALVICKCSNEGKKELVNLFLPELGRLVTEANLCCSLHLEALRTLNSILDSLPREERKKFPLSEEMCSLTKDLAKTILEVGDYDLQVALSEALCRLIIKKWRDDLVHHWFEDKYLAEAFKEIKDREFETDCRKFLNLLNERLGDKRRVYSFPCISAFADMNEAKKPSDEKLEEFWIDFNAGSQSVTFYVDCDEGPLWDSVRLSKENVSTYSVKEKDRKKIVKIFMKIPTAINKTEAVKFKLVFSDELEILAVLRKVLGDERLMIFESEDEIVHSGKEAMQNEAETPVPSNAQKRKDLSNSENVETQKDNSASQHRQQLTGTVAKMVNSGVAMVTVSQQTDLEDANQEKNSKTPSSGMKAKPSEKPLEEEPMDEQIPKILQLSPFPRDVTSKKRNRRSSLAKKRAEGRKEVYDFENSDSSSREKVAEAKGKILAQKTSSQSQRTYETRSKTKESSTLERRQSSYRKHLFSESNNENTSPDKSEKSWILDSQIQPVPKSVDYTRKRPRVRSKLKVLPVSSASSSSDYESKKEGESRQRAQKETLRKKSLSSKEDDLPIVNLADETLSDDLGGSPLLLGVSARSPSSDVEKATQKFHSTPAKLSREEESSKRKDSDILSGTIIKKPKFSSLEKNHLPSEINHTPKKISDSVKEEVEIQKGQKMDDSLDDVVFSKMLHEDLSDSGVIFAFESFIGQLKKLFWSRYKRIEINTQDALRSSEKNLSALLNQIHMCRLNKFETFRKIVVEELANLEKDTQILAAMEKEALDFWNAQLIKLNTFYSQQKERIESVDSALGETAKSFTNAVQNTTYELSPKKEEENVFIVPSD
ncbi:synaptonemal complex protein 2-like isoform X2 [Ammospiza nelsoni]|uniref:synaptonemal complex protein 2-like isoform X2 n=1 Tax=Ammospiza nelsoni TaxID=2857394 RepID=UPI00286991C7|nr:synaptonemal complex protein 2-like isoform X2 [Ammospiza nelsoni]